MTIRSILVTGATGFLGSRLVERIAENEAMTITATGRSLKPHNRVDAPNVRYELGDLTDDAFVARLVQGQDAIVHAAALSSPWGSKRAFWASNVRPTELLVRAAETHGVDRLVLISTPSMYFQMKSQWDLKEEDTLPKPINQYAASKREAERVVEASGIPYVILRPRALLGRGDTVILPRIIRAHQEGRLRQMGPGLNRVDMTPVSNVVDAIVLSLNAPEQALNQTYNISNGDPIALWPFLNDTLDKLGLTPISKSIPLPVVLMVARLMEWHARWLNQNREPALTVYGVGTLSMDFSMDISKAQRLLGYTPNQTVEEAMDEFVAWHKQQP